MKRLKILRTTFPDASSVLEVARKVLEDVLPSSESSLYDILVPSSSRTQRESPSLNSNPRKSVIFVAMVIRSVGACIVILACGMVVNESKEHIRAENN